MSRLDAFFGRIQSAAVDLALGFGLNFTSGLSAVRNPTTKFIDVGVADGSLGAAQLAPPAADMGVPFVIGPISFALTFVGTPHDTLILSDAPFGFTILDVVVHVNAATDPAITATLRTATGGGGSVLSSTMALNATGTFRNNDTQTRTVNAGGNIYLRRSTDVDQGSVYILAVRT
jgi:hypothetical protein